jgi:hypothetical protein
VFIAADHCFPECVGIHAHPQATRFQALEPIRQGVGQRSRSPPVRPCGMTLDRNTCRTTSRRRCLSRHREFARLRPGARGQWLCRAVHPYTQGKSAVGAEL